MTRIDNARVIRAAHGTELSAKSWLTEAPLRMLMNNLDPDVAEKPGELVVYGGIGRAARDWDSFDRIVAALKNARGRRDAARAVGQAGRRLPHACGCAARADRQLQPRAALGHLGPLPRARSQGAHDVRPDDGRLVDLYRHPGHRAGHLRDLRRGRPPALRRRPLRPLDPDRRPRRHGRRAAARRHHGGRLLPCGRMPAEPHRDAPAHRLCRPARRHARRGAGDHRAILPRQEAGLGRPARQRRRDLPGDLSARRPSRCGHRPDLRARSDQRLSAEGLDARRVGEQARERSEGRGARGEALHGRARARHARLPQGGRADPRLRQQHPPDGEGGRRRQRLRFPRLRAGLYPPALLPRHRPVPLGRALGRSRRTSTRPTPR